MNLTNQMSVVDLNAPPEVFENTCNRCGQLFIGTILFNRIRQMTCDPCVERARTIEAEEAKAKRIASKRRQEWESICKHSEYRLVEDGGKSDLGRIIKEQVNAERILSTPWSSKGVIIRGESGCCKTRCMWALMRSYWAKGKTVEGFTAGEFEREMRDAAGKFTLTDVFDRLVSLDCFLLDDLGKTKWSEATLQAFFDLVEHRTSNEKPIYITTNYSRETLSKKFDVSPDLAAPLVRRLLEFSDNYVFLK